MVELAEILPSPENETLYGPVSSADREVIELARSIRDLGVREPLVITSDNYILSGHRRCVACRMVGLLKVPCRVIEITRDDPAFVRLLREHNRQRVKTFDQILREEIVSASANQERAYQQLVEHRKRRADVNCDTIAIVGEKHRANLSKAKKPFLEAVEEVLWQREQFWPLTLRQIHYALLNDPPLKHASKPESTYANDLRSYKSLSDLLTRARLSAIPFRLS
jgi:hypothetical protein